MNLLCLIFFSVNLLAGYLGAEPFYWELSEKGRIELSEEESSSFLLALEKFRLDKKSIPKIIAFFGDEHEPVVFDVLPIKECLPPLPKNSRLRLKLDPLNDYLKIFSLTHPTYTTIINLIDQGV